MSMRVSIDSTETKTRSGTGSKGAWSITTQIGYADLGKRYPSEIKIRLADDAKPYPVGEYEVDVAASSYVSKYDSLALSEELVLLPVGVKLAAAK